MSAPDRLPSEALDGLLDGSPSEEAVGTPLAAYLDAVRDRAAATEPVPSDELRMVLADGLEPSELGAGEATTASSGFLPSWRGRGRLVARALVTKFAALGLVAKMAATGAAVTVAASGAGAAGVLPPPAQSTFNEVVGREAPVEDVEEDADQGTEADETSPATPADTSTTPPLDDNVPDDATGTSDGEPGVDGGDVADDASDGRRAPAEDAPREPPAGERTDDTPAGDVVDETPATEPPAEGEAPRRDDGAADDSEDHAEDGAADQEPRVSPPGQHPEQEGTESDQAEQDAGEQELDTAPSEPSEPDQRPARS